MCGCGGGDSAVSVPQYGLGQGERGGIHTGTYMRMLHLAFSDLPLKKCPSSEFYYSIVIYYHDTPCAETIFLGLTNIFPIKEGFTAE